MCRCTIFAHFLPVSPTFVPKTVGFATISIHIFAFSIAMAYFCTDKSCGIGLIMSVLC